MKNIFSSMAVALFVWLGLAASAANAAVLTLSDWTGSATTGYTATFGNSGQSYAFTDAIPFSLPSDASGNLMANVYDTTENALGMVFWIFIYTKLPWDLLKSVQAPVTVVPMTHL